MFGSCKHVQPGILSQYSCTAWGERVFIPNAHKLDVGDGQIDCLIKLGPQRAHLSPHRRHGVVILHGSDLV